MGDVDVHIRGSVSKTTLRKPPKNRRSKYAQSQSNDKNKEERLNKVVMTSRHHKAKKIQLQKGKEHYQELLERLSKMSKELDKQLI
uniref:Uncharacterized protein n=1 Tax=Acrobeloides nanus TaxID=290746 RepID=A0A914D3L6_9BILA